MIRPKLIKVAPYGKNGNTQIWWIRTLWVGNYRKKRAVGGAGVDQYIYLGHHAATTGQREPVQNCPLLVRLPRGSEF